MNTNLHKRLGAIEAMSTQSEDFVVKRVIFVGHGEPGEIHSCRLMGHPERFVRTPDETEDGFMARVEGVARARREPGQYVAVALCPADGNSSEVG